MWIEDLHVEMPLSHGSKLVAVGYLDREHPYTKGACDYSVYAKLVELLNDPWCPAVSPGGHSCNLCRFYPEARGFTTLFVPGDSVLYICSDLITHYINVHEYCPPEEFCKAVLDCPPMRSMAYLRAIQQCGALDLTKLPIETDSDD
jgi:hypothetical protein